jgi:hypothetical protein
VIELRQPRQQRSHGVGGEIVWPDRGQATAVAAKRRPDRVDDVGVSHGSAL